MLIQGVLTAIFPSQYAIPKVAPSANDLLRHQRGKARNLTRLNAVPNTGVPASTARPQIKSINGLLFCWQCALHRLKPQSADQKDFLPALFVLMLSLQPRRPAPPPERFFFLPEKQRMLPAQYSSDQRPIFQFFIRLKFH